MSPLRASLGLALPALLLALAGCGEPQPELQVWIDQQRREVKPNVAPLAPPKTFQPQPYLVSDRVDPFNLQKLSGAQRLESRQSSALLNAETSRRKEPLEAFPLDTMTMVGSVVRGGRQYALLRVENLLYQVKPGDYLGPNFGKIVKISETEIALREIVQDASGEWVERTASLQLQEKAK